MSAKDPRFLTQSNVHPAKCSLKSHPAKLGLVTGLLDTWRRLYATDQAVLVEGVERLSVSTELKFTAHKALDAAAENLRQDPHSQRSHAALFVGNKLLSLYSSKNAQELAACDILFLALFHQSLPKAAATAGERLLEATTSTHLLLLQSQVRGPFAGCIPHIVHIVRLPQQQRCDKDAKEDAEEKEEQHDDDNAVLVLCIEYGSLPVASGLYDIFYALHKTRMLQLQNDVDGLKPAFDKLDGYVRQELDALRRAKLTGSDVESAVRRFGTRWDGLRKKYVELFRGSDRDSVVAIESNLPGFADALRDLFRAACVECGGLENGLQRVTEIAAMVASRLTGCAEFGRLLQKRRRVERNNGYVANTFR